MILRIWLGAFFVLLGFMWLAIFMRLRAPALREEKLVRTPDHQAQVAALQDWLQDERIVRTILDSKVATIHGLQDTLANLEAMSEGDVSAHVGLILSKREVRQVVSRYVERKRGIPRLAAMKALLDWADPVRTELLQ